MAVTSFIIERPKILLLIDRRGWAFDTIAQAISSCLSDRFQFDILASAEAPIIDASAYDLLHVFYFGERYHLPFLNHRIKVLKSVYSFRWQLAGLSPDDLYRKHLREAHAISVPNRELYSLLSDLPAPVFLTPEGVDTRLFHPANIERSGPLVAGFAGKSLDSVKQFPLLQEACKGICDLNVADGSLSAEAMPDFYRSIDVLLCSSLAEGSPRPLLEAMASGVFPVTFPVGIAREVIDHCLNGFIVEDRTINGFRQALLWCRDNADAIRTASAHNPKKVRDTRRWELMMALMADVYTSLLSR